MQDWEDFLYWEKESRDIIDLKRAYIWIAQDHAAGIMLSQIIYWNLPSRDGGNTKLRVEREGRMWLAKQDSDWYAETLHSRKQALRCRQILAHQDIIECKTFPFNGLNSTHIALNRKVLMERLRAYREFCEAPKASPDPDSVQTGTEPSLDPDSAESREGLSSLTETTNRDYKQRDVPHGTTIPRDTIQHTEEASVVSVPSPVLKTDDIRAQYHRVLKPARAEEAERRASIGKAATESRNRMEKVKAEDPVYAAICRVRDVAQRHPQVFRAWRKILQKPIDTKVRAHIRDLLEAEVLVEDYTEFFVERYEAEAWLRSMPFTWGNFTRYVGPYLEARKAQGRGPEVGVPAGESFMDRVRRMPGVTVSTVEPRAG